MKSPTLFNSGATATRPCHDHHRHLIMQESSRLGIGDLTLLDEITFTENRAVRSHD